VHVPDVVTLVAYDLRGSVLDVKNILTRLVGDILAHRILIHGPNIAARCVCISMFAARHSPES